MNLKIFLQNASILAIALQFGSCQNIAKNNAPTDDLQWVSISVEVAMLTDTTDYFYYGQMDADKVQRLSEKGSVPLFFDLRNIRYWNDSNKLEIYEDSSFVGTRIFLTKDLKNINLMKDDPVLTFDKEDLTETALAFRLKHRKPAERFTQGKK